MCPTSSVYLASKKQSPLARTLLVILLPLNTSWSAKLMMALLRDFVVMICLRNGQHGLAFTRGRRDWTLLPGSTRVEDIFYSRKDKVFYSMVTKDGEIQDWDFNNADKKGFPKRIDFDFDIRYCDFHYPDFFHERVQNNLYCTKYYLVESSEGEILFLVRYSVSIGKDGSFVNARDFLAHVHLPIRTAFFAPFKLDF